MRKPQYLVPYLQSVAQDPEVWLAAFLQLLGYLMRKPKAILRNRITVDTFIHLYKLAAEQRHDYGYFKHTMIFAMLRLG